MKKFNSIFVITFLVVIMMPIFAFAESKFVLPEYTEEYKKWLELPEEEKANYMEPKMYKDVETSDSNLNLRKNNIVSAPLESKFERTDYGSVKNQGETEACWAFSAATVFDTNYFVTHQNRKQFSNYHMDYMTSNNYNPEGFNRKFNSGGNIYMALSYATNGMGIALENAMPKTGINISNLKTIPKEAKVNDYVTFNSRNEVKNYLKKYGVISSCTYIDNNLEFFSSKNVWNNNDLAYYCPSYFANHAITIIGWDDNYTNSAFPGKKGAYKILNSYGPEFGNNGTYYIFYDDAMIEYDLLGVTSVEDIEYDNLYQYDEYGPITAVGMVDENDELLDVYAGNRFKRNSSSSEGEFLTEISSCFYEPVDVVIYVNANGSDMNINNATNVIRKTISEPGYHTIQLDEPIKLNGNDFSVVIKTKLVAIELPAGYEDSWCYTASSNPNESFYSEDGINYEDLYDEANMNVCLKAFTQVGNYSKVNITKNINEAGNVTSSKYVKDGNSITVNATANAGYRFVGWYKGNNLLSTNSSYTFTVNNDTDILARFEYIGDIANFLFDYKYYADHNPDLYVAFGYNEGALRNHWNSFGKNEGRKASPIFDVAYYLESNTDVKKAYGMNFSEAYNHFINYGFGEYRASSMEYSGMYYKNSNSDLKDLTSMELIRHYVNFGKKELRIANINYDVVGMLFDPGLYAEFNPDVVNVFGNNENALRKHWYENGIKEGRIASLIFDAKFYLKANSDIAQVFGSNNYLAAYNHFVNYGFAEGRKATSIFSTTYYLSNNSDLKDAFGNNYLQAVNHFVCFGKNELNRITSPDFRVRTYRAKNVDLRQVYGDNYEMYYKHYLRFGQYENRICK